MKPGACERLNAMCGLLPVSFEVAGVDGGLHKVLRRLPLFSFQQELQGLEIGVELFLELLADQSLRHLEEASDLALEIYGQLRSALPSGLKREDPWNGIIGPSITLNPVVLGGSHIVISLVNSNLRPRNLITCS